MLGGCLGLRQLGLGRRLGLLRHGQSPCDRGKVFTGGADPDLTSRGRDEAVVDIFSEAQRIDSLGRIHSFEQFQV